MKATIEKLSEQTMIATGLVFQDRKAYIETDEGRTLVLPIFLFRPKDGQSYAVTLKRVRVRNSEKTRFFLASPRSEQFLTRDELREATQLVCYVTWQKGKDDGVISREQETGMVIVPNRRAWEKILGREPKVGEEALVSLSLSSTYLMATPIKVEEGVVGGAPMVVAAEAENLQSGFERRHVLSPEGKWLNAFSDVLGIDEVSFKPEDAKRAYRSKASQYHTDKIPKGIREEVRKLLEQSAGQKLTVLKEALKKALAYYHMYHEEKCGYRKQDGQLCENKRSAVGDFCKMHADKRAEAEVEMAEVTQ